MFTAGKQFKSIISWRVNKCVYKIRDGEKIDKYISEGYSGKTSTDEKAVIEYNTILTRQRMQIVKCLV